TPAALRRIAGDRALNLVTPDRQVRILVQGDGDRCHERVALRRGMLAYQRCQLVSEGDAVRRQPLVVLLGQVDHELVGHQRAPGSPGAALVTFPGQRPGELDRLDPALEDAGEGALDDAAETAFEALQHPHTQLLPRSALIVTAGPM